MTKYQVKNKYLPSTVPSWSSSIVLLECSASLFVNFGLPKGNPRESKNK